MKQTWDYRIRPTRERDMLCAYCRSPAAFTATWLYHNHYGTQCKQHRPLCEKHGMVFAEKHDLEIAA